MLHSMTGFARHTAELPDGVLTCELRSVNHRWLDVQLRLPDELRPAEGDFRKRIGAALKRGKVDCALHLRRAGIRADLALNQSALDQLHAAFTALAATFPNLRAPDPMDLLRWPGVIEEPQDEPGEAGAAAVGEAMQVLDTALEAIRTMRANEGDRIAEMLELRCRDVMSIAESVRARMPEVLEAARAKQRERLDKLAIDADPARIAAELALIAQKQDVDEELDRLVSHVSEIRQVIESPEPVGRRLDFLMQELNREANTLGSKAGDTETTRAAVDLKVLIEQMREQIQNVE